MKLAWLTILLAVPCTSLGWEVVLGGGSDTSETAADNVSRFAMLDDVRLLANGMLQLGQSLREFVQKTKGQIKDIFQKLTIFDNSFYQLSVVTSEIKEEEEELKKTTSLLKANNEKIKNMSLEISTKVDTILLERGELQSKMGGLEERLSGLSKSITPLEQLSEIPALKEMINAQDRNIQTLLKAVREQHDQLVNQNSKIRSLEEKLHYETLQDTTDKTEELKEPNHILHLRNISGNDSLDTDSLPSDCSEVFKKGERKSGIYSIKPNQSDPFHVYCEIGKDGMFTVIQRRYDGSMDFDQSWEEYRNGFGNLEGEFWLGLEKIHTLALKCDCLLYIQLEDWRGEKHTAEYQFSLEGAFSLYSIHLKQVSGDLPDAMTSSDGMRFSTKDRDNDNYEDFHCAQNYTGGWWFNACGDANLNGKYTRTRPKGRMERRSGIYWRSERGSGTSLKSTKLSLRHKDNPSSH